MYQFVGVQYLTSKHCFILFDNNYLYCILDILKHPTVFFRELVRFCFTRIIQHELDQVRQEWNDHKIRRQNRHEIHGQPELLYSHPDLYGTVLLFLL